jgi:uncharacterized protein with PIN domain
VTVFAESSAVLAWLLSEPLAERVARVLADAGTVVASDLTVVECDRALHRIARLPRADGQPVEAIRARFIATAADWSIEPISAAVVDRARQSFPDDAIRSLDAIHLATALVVRATLGDLDVLSLDERIRSNARALGFPVLPD